MSKWTNIIMDDWILDEKLLGKWQYLQLCKPIIPQKSLQGRTNNVGLAFSVGDTIPRLTISIEQDD